MPRATKNYEYVGEVKPKIKALRHFKVEAVQKFDDQVIELSRPQCMSVYKKFQHIRSRRLAGYRQHMYKCECLVLFYRKQNIHINVP